jgi:hypothetical protein
MSRTIFYRRVCDLPATVDPPSLGRIVMSATHVWALTMPTPLGQAVRYDMGRRGVAAGPIVAYPRSFRWSFLIRPDVPEDVPLFAELFQHNVSVIRDGGTIALPSPTGQVGAIRQWVEPPRDMFRPSGLAVIASVRACLGPGKARTVSHA